LGPSYLEKASHKGLWQRQENVGDLEGRTLVISYYEKHRARKEKMLKEDGGDRSIEKEIRARNKTQGCPREGEGVS